MWVSMACLHITDHTDKTRLRQHMHAMCVSITGRPRLVSCSAPPPEMRANGTTLRKLKILRILSRHIKTRLLSLCPTTEACNRDHLSAEGSSRAEVTEQRRVSDVVKACSFACYCPLCLSGTSILLSFYWDIAARRTKKKKSKADKNVLIATIASVRAVYD